MAKTNHAPAKPAQNVLLLENIHLTAQSHFEKAGYNVELLPGALAEEELKSRLQNVSILGIRSGTQVSETVLKAAPGLMAIGAFCIGTNQIDLTAAARSGVAVFNAPFSNTRSVVELAIGEMIALSRKLMEVNARTHAGVWEKSAADSHELRGKTLGIVGYGNIGSQLSVLAENLGLSVIFYDAADKLSLGNARRMDSLDELLATADIVTVHVDGRAENRNLFGKHEFSKLKPGALFLNLSRGHVVDEQALAAALQSGRLAGAAVDVYQKEPKGKEKNFTHILQQFPNAILTPHIGGSTEESQESIGSFVSNKLLQYALTGSTNLSVNFPHLQLPEQADAHRLVHTHTNVPGTLVKINALLAENGANIAGQYLGTKNDIGYVITDINATYDKAMLARLQELPETIRMRVLY